MKKRNDFLTNGQLTFLVISRISMGWYFLYEGAIKLANPNWSSLGYLKDSKGIFSGIFNTMATHSGMLKFVDFLNIWGLLVIGLALLLGLFERIAAIGGIILLSMYFLSHPPLIGVEYIFPSEGSYLWINKTFLEICLMTLLLVFPTGNRVGLGRFFNK